MEFWCKEVPLCLSGSGTLQGWGLTDWSSDRRVMVERWGRRVEGEREKERENDKGNKEEILGKQTNKDRE